MAAPDDVTRLIERSRAGDPGAAEELMPLIYDELRRRAERFLRSERAGHTLQPTALVHEAYARLVGADGSWNDRAHFFRAATTALRRILVEHARSRRSRRQRELPPGAVEVQDVAADRPAGHVLAVDEALGRLAATNPAQARLVELRFFGGFSVEETAQVLEMSPRTVAREWVLAKAWLAREIREVLGLDD